MRRLTLLLRFEPQAVPGDTADVTFTVKSGGGAITVLDGADGDVPATASYETHVRMTGETSFVETGTYTLDGGGLTISTVGEGVMEPSPEDGALQGLVTWRVQGTGRYASAAGTVASSFVFEPERGVAVEHQVVRLFLS